MKQLLTILHAENRLSPSVLSLVKGGDVPLNPICRLDNCNKDLCIQNQGNCIVNKCYYNYYDCDINECHSNCINFNSLCKEWINPNPDCPTAIQF